MFRAQSRFYILLLLYVPTFLRCRSSLCSVIQPSVLCSVPALYSVLRACSVPWACSSCVSLHRRRRGQRSEGSFSWPAGRNSPSSSAAWNKGTHLTARLTSANLWNRSDQKSSHKHNIQQLMGLQRWATTCCCQTIVHIWTRPPKHESGMAGLCPHVNTAFSHLATRLQGWPTGIWPLDSCLDSVRTLMQPSVSHLPDYMGWPTGIWLVNYSGGFSTHRAPSSKTWMLNLVS